MKKGLKITLIILGVLVGIALIIGIYFVFKNNNKPETTELLKNTSMVIKEGSLTNTGCTVIITDTEKEEKHTYGEGFSLEIKKDNEWQNLKPKTENYIVHPIAYTVDENNELEFDINWEWLYGKLEPGNYRIVKSASIDYQNGKTGSGVVYAEFTINASVIKLSLNNNEENPISIMEEASYILDLFNKYEYTKETCDGETTFNLIVGNTTYGLEVYNQEVHITTIGKEIVLNKEDSIKIINIINKYIKE